METTTINDSRARAAFAAADAADAEHIDPFLEAAWYALNPFINPIDCARKVKMTTSKGKEYNAAIPLNYNDKLNALYNGDLVENRPVKPTWFSKKRLASHLTKRETYYYRSRPNALWREGYGSFDRARLKLGIAADALQIDRTCKRYPIGVVLLCADIDCHNGEKDVAAVRDWLLDSYFPGAYWEPSTGGDGVHLYIKLAYRPWLLKDRDATVRYVVNTINHVAVMLNSERLQRGYDAPVDGLRGLPSLLAEKNSRLHIQRSSCIKIPRFANGLQDVRSFHFSPFFLFDYFERLARQEQHHPSSLDNEPVGLVANALGWDIEHGSAYRPLNKCGGDIALNSVYPSYTDYLDDLRQQEDAFTRTMGFGLAYSRHLRRVPSVNEAVTEYETQGLATGADVNGVRRIRIEYVLGHIAKTFKPSIDLASGFQKAQEALVAEIRSLIAPNLDLTFTKARGRRVAAREIDLAALLHAMRQSQGNEDRTEFSQLQISRAIKATTGRSCNKNMASCLTKALISMDLIERVGGYIPNKRGIVYRVSRGS
jgi:hypothetical protein